jgi:hypothetical protein
MIQRLFCFFRNSTDTQPSVSHTNMNNTIFRPNIVALAARLNKWQVRYLRKQAEHAEKRAIYREKVRKQNFPAPEAKWMYKQSWKDTVRAEQIKDIIRQTRYEQRLATNN